MERVVLVSCAVFLISYFCFDVILASQKFDGTSEPESRNDDNSKENVFSHLLGRHKRSFRGETEKPRELRWADLLKEYYADPPFTTGNDEFGAEKRDDTKIDGHIYFPRAGRNIDEDILENEKWLQDSDNSAEYVIQRSPPFAPRLGKRMPYLYAPRLERDS